MSRLARVALPVALIVAGLTVAYIVQKPDSGVEVRAVAGGEPAAAYVRITAPAGRGELAGGPVARGATERYRLDPGAYVVRAEARSGMRAAPIRVQVHDGRYERVVVHYREVRRGH